MNEPLGTPAPDMPDLPPVEPRKSNQGLIIGIVVAVVLCCCCVAIAGLWFGGDYLVQFLNQNFGTTF
jgi:hypothetical protein